MLLHIVQIVCHSPAQLTGIKSAVGGGEPTMKYITRWSKHSPLRTCWYNFAVELVGKSNADIIKATHSHSCLQRVLVTWYESTTNHSWQIIVDALTQMDETRVIESIKEECQHQYEVLAS